MSASTAAIYVDTIHLNIGIGDCSIVCKLQHATPKPILLEAVLIDGGFAEAWKIIKPCLNKTIPELYDLTHMPNGKKTVQFRSVVITHWDGDHYGGVNRMIAKDLTAQLGEETDPEVIAKFRCQYFIYDGLIPLTTMYVPYWTDESAGKSGPLDHMEREISGNIAYLNYNLGKNGQDVKHLCILKSSFQTNLGQNFFTGDGPVVTENMRNRQNLVAALLRTNHISAEEPALVCVACNEHGLWETPLAGSSSSGSASSSSSSGGAGSSGHSSSSSHSMLYNSRADGSTCKPTLRFLPYSLRSD